LLVRNGHPSRYFRAQCKVTSLIRPMPLPLRHAATFLANVRYILSPVRLSYVCRLCVCLSSVCNARAPYSGGSNFRQYFYGIRYLGHPLRSTENFTEIVLWGTPPQGELKTRGVAKYSDFGPIDGYILEKVQDMT